VTTYELARDANRRIWRRTCWIVGTALIAGAVVGGLPFHHHQGLVVDVIASMLTFGGLAGMFSLFPARIGRSDELRLPLLGLERSARRAITRTALGRRGGDLSRLSPDERRRALEYAEAFSVNQPIILTQTLLLLVGLIGTQLLAGDDTDPFLRWVRLIYLTAIPAFLIVMTIFSVKWIRRATTYVQRHAKDGEGVLPDVDVGL